MNIRSLLYCALLCFLLFSSCQRNDIPADIRNSLDHAGNNKSELLKVIAHYSKNPADSLKLKAARFLIQNMDGWHYYTGNQLTHYMDYPKLVLRDLDHGEYIIGSFQKMYGSFNADSMEMKHDLQEIKSEELISNVDAAFKAWNSQPWAKDYSFTQFCGYVLPFRINDEVPAYNREEIYNKFNKIIDTVSEVGLDAVKACSLINNVLIKEGWILSNRVSYLPNYNANTLIENRVGTCTEMGDLAIYVMRAVGIPVAIDFIPQWPYRSLGHNWNVVFDKTGKAISFLGAEDSPGTPHRPMTKRGKIYRRTFTVNPLSIQMISGKDDVIPEFMRDPKIYDVTDEYFKTFTVEIPFDKNTGKRRFGYLSLFNNVDWVPVSWAKLYNYNAKFEKLEGGIVYLPNYYDESGIIPANDPFILDVNGRVKYLKADTLNKIAELICDRVYPIVPENYLVDEATGGKFQGANKPDYSDAQDLFVFSRRALPFWNDLEVKNKHKFRYVRYISSDQKFCQVAELEYYSFDKKLKGTLTGSMHADSSIVENVADGNELTAYGSEGRQSFISLDLGVSRQISKIRFLARLDIRPNTLIIPEKVYKLKYWHDNEWKLLGTQQAKKNFLSFKRIPSNALMTLSTDSTNREKRIFTVENGKQKWW